MCLFIYTLPQLCNHLCFQNVSECAVARGIPHSQTSSLTLQEPVFLFDTKRSRSRTPEYYSKRFACKKRKAIRPVPTLCERCDGGGGAARTGVRMVGTLSTSFGSGGVGVGVGGGGGGAEPIFLKRHDEERRLLLAANNSAVSLGGRSDSSSVSSTAGSIWKETNPLETV